MTNYETLEKKYQIEFGVFGRKQLKDIKEQVRWIRRNVHYSDEKNYNVLVMAYWFIFDKVRKKEDVKLATPVETIVRSCRA